MVDKWHTGDFNLNYIEVVESVDGNCYFFFPQTIEPSAAMNQKISNSVQETLRIAGVCNEVVNNYERFITEDNRS